MRKINKINLKKYIYIYKSFINFKYLFIYSFDVFFPRGGGGAGVGKEDY